MRLLEYVLMGLGILCFLYLGFIFLATRMAADAGYLWVILGGGCILLALALRRESAFPGTFPAIAKISAGLILAALLLLASVTVIPIFSHMGDTGEDDLDYVIVLGAQVRGDVPSLSLRRRLDCALLYASRSPDTRFILSGGQGSGEDISEAECMREYLVSHGLDEGRLILEDASTSTMENLAFSAGLSDAMEKRTGIITSNFHVCRAIRLAEKMGYRHVSGIAARSVAFMQPHYILREIVAMLKERLLGNI